VSLRSCVRLGISRSLTECPRYDGECQNFSLCGALRDILIDDIVSNIVALLKNMGIKRLFNLLNVFHLDFCFRIPLTDSCIVCIIITF
jgi:hypothetical protein